MGSYFRTKILLFILAVAIIFGAVFFVNDTTRTPTPDVPTADTVVVQEEPTIVEESVVVSEKEVSTPGGLRGELAPAQHVITVAGVIVETNKQRALHGLPPLSFNAQLTSAAQTKAFDMIAREYFEHESPDGVGPGDLVENTGYTYLAVAENLALGDYESDAVLVQAWMDSPGHRENILNEAYTEIGVAVAQGMYEGYLVWFAVQEFARPASDCPAPDETLAVRIEDSQEALEDAQEILEESREELENTDSRGRAYNDKVDVYNELVRSYNELLEETKTLIERYNAQVRRYNACVKG